MKTKINFQKIKQEFSKTKVLVVGDFMIDNYIIGKSSRISPEAPVPIIIPEKKYSVPGGAGNVASNLCALGATVSCIGVIGNDQWGTTLIDILDNEIDTSHIVLSDLYPTTLKQRIYLEEKQVLRVDEEKILNHSHNEEINHSVNNILQNCDIIVLSDYDKGVLNSTTISHILNKAKKYNIPVIVDPKKNDFSLYKGANIITPNLNELQIVSKVEINHYNLIPSVCNNLIQENGFDYIITTQGKKGMTIVGENFVKHIKAYSIKNPDVTGAGDTVVAALTLAFANTKDIEFSTKFANVAAFVVVSKNGTVCANIEEIKKTLDNSK